MTSEPLFFAEKPERRRMSAGHWRFGPAAAMQRPQRHAETAFAPDIF